MKKKATKRIRETGKSKSEDKSSRKKSPATLCPKARSARMPGVIHPMLATLVDEPFSNPEWIFETKWDGFRAVCLIENNHARFVSRNQLDMTHQYPELRSVGKQVKAKEAIIDGEIVPARGDLILPFSELQKRLGRKTVSDDLLASVPVVLVAYDLLYADGRVLMTLLGVPEPESIRQSILQAAAAWGPTLTKS